MSTQLQQVALHKEEVMEQAAEWWWAAVRAAFTTVLGALLWLSWSWWQRRQSSAKDSALASDFADIAKQSVNGITDPMAFGGKTERYQWGQTEEEVIVEIACAPGTRSKNVDCKIASQEFRILFAGNDKPVLQGELYRRVLPEDSTWEIETRGTERIITVTLQKAQRTSASTHWRCVVKGEPEIDKGKFGPSFIRTSGKSPKEIADMVSLMKE